MMMINKKREGKKSLEKQLMQAKKKTNKQNKTTHTIKNDIY